MRATSAAPGLHGHQVIQGRDAFRRSELAREQTEPVREQARSYRVRFCGELWASVPHSQPDELAGVIRFLLSEQASFTHGTVVFADGGMNAMMRPNRF